MVHQTKKGLLYTDIKYMCCEITGIILILDIQGVFLTQL